MRHVIIMVAAVGIWIPAAACAPAAPATSPAPALLGTAGAPRTDREALDRTVADMGRRLSADSHDAEAAIRMAEALLRLTRVTGNAGLTIRAEQVLVRVLDGDPDRYDVRRMLAAVYLSQHRFAHARDEARRCLRVRQDDVWVYGVLGDAELELGRYEEAFDAFDQMSVRKPNAAAYARASYARELQGDPDGALRLMRMAADATPPSDPESQAWHRAQIGYLLLDRGQLVEAGREFRHAAHLFPDHPLASDGLIRVAVAQGDTVTALARLHIRLTGAPLPDDHALSGDLLLATGDRQGAERQYRLAEAAWRADAPEPVRLARFLAERGRHLEDALRLATDAWAERQDIFTADALAWSHFQLGHLAEADRYIRDALRTGSRDRVIQYHAAAIAARMGRDGEARTFLRSALADLPRFDLVAAPAATVLRTSLTSGRMP